LGASQQQSIPPGAIISCTTAASLKTFCELDARELTLAMILQGASREDPFVTPQMASELGRLVFPKRLRDMAAHRLLCAEETELRDLLATLRFRTVEGSWSAADDLLIGHEPAGRHEEHRRAAFAPTGNVLGGDYKGDALQFFLACRSEMRASAEVMARWILRADENKTRKAGLEYLERGELSYAVRLQLTDNVDELERSWLGDSRTRREAMAGMDADRQAVIMGMLGKGTEYVEERTSGTYAGVDIGPPPQRPAEAILGDILSWWRRSRQDIITAHDRTVYPQGHLPRLSFSATAEELELDAAIRKEWLILFMLGAMHRIGRTTHHQNRGFLDLCDERGWLDILAGRADDPSQWFGVMDDYLDSLQGEASYFHWMNQFLAYYQLARWLPSYVRAFEAVTRPRVNLSDLGSIRDIADLRTSHVFARSTGFDAPPCGRTMGLGSHFVLRETIRARALQINNAYVATFQLARLAFVPSLAVRRLLGQITGRSDLLDTTASREELSGTIADILQKSLGDDATFAQSFDIPLLVLTWNRFADQRRALLGGAGDWDTPPMDFLDEGVPEEDEE